MPSTLGIVDSRAFTPLDLSPALWLDAADTATITESGGSVSQWNDKSGNGRHVSQATAAQQPTTGAATHNGRNVVSFNGSQDLRNAAPNLDSDLTIVSVFKVAAATTYTMPGIMLGSGNLGRPVDYWTTSTSTRRTYIDGRLATTLGSNFKADHFIFKSWVLTYSKNTAASTRVAEYVNNSQNFDVSDATSHTVSGQTLVVGRREDGVTRLNGQVAEAFIFAKVLSHVERSDLHIYLESKWGL